MPVRLGLELIRYKVRCVFCRREHESEYWDDLDAEILRCRDEAPAWKRGDLESYEDPLLRPISPETSALMAAALDSRVDAGCV